MDSERIASMAARRAGGPHMRARVKLDEDDDDEMWQVMAGRGPLPNDEPDENAHVGKCLASADGQASRFSSREWVELHGTHLTSDDKEAGAPSESEPPLPSVDDVIPYQDPPHSCCWSFARMVMISVVGTMVGLLGMMGVTGMMEKGKLRHPTSAEPSDSSEPNAHSVLESSRGAALNQSWPPAAPAMPSTSHMPPRANPPPPQSSPPPPPQPSPAPQPPSPTSPSPSPFPPPPLPPPLAPWYRRADTNCDDDHGARDLDNEVQVPDLNGCMAACAAIMDCEGIVVSNFSPFACYLRAQIHLDQCQQTDRFQLYLRPPSHQCHRECARNVLPQLPVLTSSNRMQYPLWHAYVERAYHQRIEGSATLDANAWSFMYRGDLSESLLAADSCLEVCELEAWPNRRPVYEGTPFVGDAGPESLAGSGGFLVHRPFITDDAAQACSRLEVMHVKTEWLDGESGVSWFFHAIGSGVFLDCHDLPVSGSIEVHRNRQAFVDDHGGWWGERGDAEVRDKMEDHDIALLIFTASDFTVFGTDGTNPSTEFIVRHAQRDSTEVSTDRRSCLDDPAIGIRFWTGINGQVPCVCEVREPPNAALNCALTPFEGPQVE